MVKGSNGDENIYTQKPHMAMDNYFSDETVIKWNGQNRFGVTMTYRRDQLSPGVPSTYFHKEKTHREFGVASVKKSFQRFCLLDYCIRYVRHLCCVPATSIKNHNCYTFDLLIIFIDLFLNTTDCVFCFPREGKSDNVWKDIFRKR